MHVSLVMTVIGQDKPGLVDAVAGIIADHGGNWLESRMSHLGGQFAGILRVQVPDSCNRDGLRGDLEKIAADLIIDLSFAELPMPSARGRLE